jgi:choline dehydrogenase
MTIGGSLGCTGWGWDDVLPLFLKSEDYFAGASEHHGAGGEWRVENSGCAGRCWTISPAPPKRPASPRSTISTPAAEGVGYFKVNQRGGWRVSTAKAFLRPA